MRALRNLLAAAFCALLPSLALADPAPNTSQLANYASWTQTARTPDIAVTTSSTDTALGVSAPVAAVYNLGASYAYVRLNNQATTVTAAAGVPVPPGGCVMLNAAGQSHVAAITASGSTTLQVSMGWGNPFAACGGSAASGGATVNIADGTPVGPFSLTSSGTLFTVANTAGYASISVQVTSAGVGATISYQVSDDGIAWAAANCYVSAAAASSPPIGSTTTIAQLICPLTAKQFRAQVTAYASGTVTALATLRFQPVPKQAMQVGISTSGNNVGGYNTDLTACNSGCTINTLAVAASAHAAGSAIGGLQTFAYFRTAGGTGIVNNVDWKWRTGTNLTPVTVYIFDSNPTASTCTDAVALSIAAADVPKLIKGSPFVLNPAIIGTGSTFSVGAQQLPLSVKNGDSSTGLYVCVTANAPITPAANDAVLGVAGIQD